MSATFDFQALIPATDHRDADLLADLARLSDLWAQLALTKRQSSTDYKSTLGLVSRECSDLENVIAATPAHMASGQHAKALDDLCSVDPDLPCGRFQGFSAVALLVLHDIFQA